MAAAVAVAVAIATPTPITTTGKRTSAIAFDSPPQTLKQQKTADTRVVTTNNSNNNIPSKLRVIMDAILAQAEDRDFNIGSIDIEYLFDAIDIDPILLATGTESTPFLTALISALCCSVNSSDSETNTDIALDLDISAATTWDTLMCYYRVRVVSAIKAATDSDAHAMTHAIGHALRDITHYLTDDLDIDAYVTYKIFLKALLPAVAQVDPTLADQQAVLLLASILDVGYGHSHAFAFKEEDTALSAVVQDIVLVALDGTCSANRVKCVRNWVQYVDATLKVYANEDYDSSMSPFCDTHDATWSQVLDKARAVVAQGAAT